MSQLARWSLVLAFLTAAAAAIPARAGVTSLEVERAIRDGIAYLRRTQLADGAWPGEAGVTELATLALLTAGVPRDDPDVARALDLVRRLDPDRIAPGHRTYTVALHAMTLAAADPGADRLAIARDAAWLVNSKMTYNLRDSRRTGQQAAAWTYYEGPGLHRDGGTGDNSNTQYALLGLNAASEAGIPVPAEIWNAARLHWEACQQADGGWSYVSSRQQSTSSMTAAGVASLIIAGSRLSHGRESLIGQTIRLCGHANEDIPLQRGLDWLAINFSVRGNVGAGRNNLYYIYGLERAGRLSGQPYFGDHDWYREGAEELVRTQHLPTGAWVDTYGPVVSTSFALLFLAKGRAPVLINKLRHGPRGDWNNDADDVRNLVGVVSRDWKNPLTWQVVDPNVATVENLLQAPIAYLSGHMAPEFDERGKKILRDFVAQGGIIVADACCGRPEFDRGFRVLMRDLFNGPGDDLHPLGADHAIWRARNALTPGIQPLWGIEHGCRTVVVYSPEDLSCYWNQAEHGASNPAVIWAIKLGQNIVDYATGREVPDDKLTARELAVLRADAPHRGALRIAKLKHGGEWNIAAMAIPNLMDTLRKPPLNFDVVLSQKDLSPSDPSLVNYPLIYLHGRAAFDLADGLPALRHHLEPGGGMIFADAACGSPAFDAAFRRFIAVLLPKHPLVPIPRDDDIYTPKVGFDLSDVQYSPSAGGRRDFPELEGVKLNGHWSIIYSKFDLGCALEQHQGPDCKGYVGESARRIAANIVIYSTLP